MLQNEANPTDIPYDTPKEAPKTQDSPNTQDTSHEDISFFTPDKMMSAGEDHDMPDIFRKCNKPNELPQYVSSKFFIPDVISESTAQHVQNVHRSLLEEVTTNKERNIFRGVLVQRGEKKGETEVGKGEFCKDGNEGNRDGMENEKNQVSEVEKRNIRGQGDDLVVFSKRRKVKGAAFSNMGTQSTAGYTFLPEEALLQAEFGMLEVFLDEDSRVPLSLQSLYEVLLPSVSLELYQTYGHLIKLGYIVKRKSRRLLDVRKPKSRDTDFSVFVLRKSTFFPELGEIMDIVSEAGTSCVKLANVTSGNVYFYTMAVVDFPDASELT